MKPQPSFAGAPPIGLISAAMSAGRLTRMVPFAVLNSSVMRPEIVFILSFDGFLFSDPVADGLPVLAFSWLSASAPRS